ncbi:hypothetical protein, partial [Escherichia coli]|uniref:hypothetical protein n=1 Tax=Escherichia coli TaxID=562 RepID=UPI0005C495B2
MTDAIVPMRMGEMPAEPGWYVVEQIEDATHRRVVQLMRMDEDLYVFDTDAPCAELLSKYDWIFIARIYSERIKP